MFSEHDIKQIRNRNLSVTAVKNQITLFKRGLPYINLQEIATINNGILQLSETEKTYYINYFEAHRNQISITKFVPASGAASRMFKSLFSFKENFNPDTQTVNAYVNRNKDNDLKLFFVGLDKFPFYNVVKSQMAVNYPDYEKLSLDHQRLLFVETMLNHNALDYSNCPKGLFPFHHYKNHIATAFEEHLFEASLYTSTNNTATLHFTVSEQYKNVFDEEFKRIQKIVERKTKTTFNISFSYQNQNTDTIAVTLDNKPYRDKNKALVFRPSGHGALLKNLNALNADLVFIKNIDNVVVNKYETELALYKKMLAGLLLSLQTEVFDYCRMLDNKKPSNNDLNNIIKFLSTKLNIIISTEYDKYSTANQIKYLKEQLNRPIRICGMVKNESEPGGGPYWVKDEKGRVSLQIVESAQINKKNRLQKEIFKNATHFNPVDLVCGIKDYKGRKFNLEDFVDPKTAFITTKTKAGKNLKTLELPGLWNGSMAYWNTIFVEVPLITFNPVKTVTDLLKPSHQN